MHAVEPLAPGDVDRHVTEGSGLCPPKRTTCSQFREDLVVHLVSRPEGSAKGFHGLGVTQVEVRPNPCSGMVVSVQAPRDSSAARDAACRTPRAG